MIRPTVEVLLSMVDQFTAPFRAATQGVQDATNKTESTLREKFSGALTGVGNSLKALGKDATDLLSNKLVQGIGLVGLWNGLQRTFEAADSFRVALQKLEGTAKITGVPLATLEEIAGRAENQFKLSKSQASDFAVEMAKLATKAGDVGKAGPAMQSFLDIGAARGLTASETLKAVQQAILGIDEGTDKLFNANPSVLYQQFAESIGTTAGKLTDQQKAQALLTAATEDGAKVQGMFSEYLGTTAGQLEISRNKTEAAYAAIGTALSTLRTSMAGAVGWLANMAQEFVGGLQILGADAAKFFLRLPHEFAAAWGMLLVAIANTIGESRVLRTVFGDAIDGIADKMGASGNRMVRDSARHMADIETGYRETVNEIVGVVTKGQAAQTAATAKGVGDRGKVTAEGDKAAVKAAEKSHKALEDLEKLAGKTQAALLTSQQREYEALVATFHEKMQGMNAADRAKAEKLLQEAHANLLLKWANFGKALEPTVIQPLHRIQHSTTLMVAVMNDLPSAGVPALQRVRAAAGEVGEAFTDAAGRIFAMVDALGITDQRVESLVGGIGRIGEGLRAVASGDLLGGLTAGISGLTSILGGIFGDSPADRARKALLQKNNERLAELRDKMDDLLKINTTGAKIAAFQGVDLQGLVNASQVRDPGKNFGKLKAGDVGKYLARQGLSLTDFRALAAELGYDLGADPNFLDPAVVVQLLDFVKTNNFAGVGGSGFAGEIERLDFLNGIENTDSTGVLSGLAGIAGGKNGSGVLAGIFAGADFTNGLDAGEIGSIRTRAIGVGQDLAAGRLTANDLGGLSNSEFIRFIERILGALETTANNTAATAEASAVTASATATTAEAVGSGRLATVVDGQVADQYAVSSINAGRI